MMSTVMYTYRVDKDRLWPVIDQIRKYYGQHSFAGSVTSKARNMKELHDTLDLIEEHDRYTRLQLFDFGDHFLFRVLESSYFFMNHCQEFDVVPVVYDDRTDVPESDTCNKEIARQIDEMIANRHFFIVSVVDREWLSMLWWAERGLDL